MVTQEIGAEQTIDSAVLFQQTFLNWINGKEVESKTKRTFEKVNPVTGKILCSIVRSDSTDIDEAIKVAMNAQKEWRSTPSVQRGQILFQICSALEKQKNVLAAVVSVETGKSFKDALGEVGGAIAQGQFMAGEGARLNGKTMGSSVPNKDVFMVREPVGVCGLIIAANTPIANVAWKVFPALICGNATILKAAEDTPVTAWLFSKIVHEAGLPNGLLNVIQGYGEEAGAALVQHKDVQLISFTGSTRVGKWVQKEASERHAKVSLELGGKNPLVVCDDADLDNAIKWRLLSSFSNAGQRCAAASRILIFESVYETIKERLIKETAKLKLGPQDSDDLGPVINEKQLNNMLQTIEDGKAMGAKVVIGGQRYGSKGFFMSPTLIEEASSENPLSQKELFGPIACLYRVKNLDEAIKLSNDSSYGLTAAIHTSNLNRAMKYSKEVEAGTVVVNAGTFGSEPHMPFGGVKESGNGFREPGTEALDVYSEWKNIHVNTLKGEGDVS